MAGRNCIVSAPNYIDLFSGSGGLSEGFVREGYNPVAHVEMEPNACLTLKTRTAYYYLKNTDRLSMYYDYLKGTITREQLYLSVPENILNSVLNYEMTEENIEEIFAQIDKRMQSWNVKKIDVIIGGPPCQAYSLVGRSRVGESIKNDKRNYLFMLYGLFLKKYKPALFVFENVPGLLSAGGGEYLAALESYYDDLGYTLGKRELNAADFGVLQNRRRIIIIGWKKDSKFSYPEFEKVQTGNTINDLFEDLPEIKPGEQNRTMKYREGSCSHSIGLRSGMPFITQHEARPHIDRDLRIYKLSIELWDKDKIRLKYTDIPKEDQTHKNTKSFVDRFKVVDGEGVSHTLVAHISKDGHYYIHPDISQLRSLSIREAARIQSFPDDYYFERCRTSAFKQIGNAVPPLMAQKIAAKIKLMIK